MTMLAKLLTHGPLPSRACANASRILAKSDSAPPAQQSKHDINSFEFRVFSQNGEDGILDHIFSVIGFQTRVFVEFGFSPSECNALRLVKREKFQGLWIDASRENCSIARMTAKLLGWRGIRAINAYVTADNINALIRDGLDSPEPGIDLLSIDIDGVDYWILQAIETIRPRVLICEYNAVFGPDRAITVPYAPEFDRWRHHRSGLYFGASLAAFETLSRTLGYRLVGCDSSGTNAFFLDGEISAPGIATKTAAACWRPMQYLAVHGINTEEKFAELSELPYVQA